MGEFRPVLLVVGALVAVLGVSMVAPMIADLTAPDPVDRKDWSAFAIGAFVAMLAGGGLTAASWGAVSTIGVRQGFLVVTASWVALVTFAAVPLWLGSLGMTYTDAFFEAMSGLTTTGATVIVGLDDAPPGILLWRSMLQWFGGVGVIIMAFAVLPALRVGGMQIFKSEAWDTSEKFVANAAQYSVFLTTIYLVLTAICFMCLWAMGMTAFDAANHAMTTISTGGFSTKDASVGYFLSTEDTPIDVVISIFMVIGSLPFGIYLVVILRGELGRLFSDDQVQFFIAALAGLTLLMLIYVYDRFNVDLFTAFRLAFFNITSVMTGTGFATTAYDVWGGFAIGFFFCIMFIGGCAGSTSCGMKIFRFQVALAAARLYARRIAHPHGVFVARYNNRPITDDVFISVLSFFFIYFASFATLAVMLSGYGLDPLTALSSAATAIANVGPGLGPIVGPSGNFTSLEDGAKWLMSAGMLLGRLEFLTVLVVFSPGMWRN
ncbi:MAG: potassium transporter TrkH [Alphaproteobacteria bacterium]|nr:potassium transporter TrkH [Alphaproteobacteria bacterium]